MNKSSILPADPASFEQPVSDNKREKEPSVLHINSMSLSRLGPQNLKF